MRSFPALYDKQLGGLARRWARAIEQLESRHLLTSLTLFPSQDTTLIQDEAGALANGAGEFLFAGRTGQSDGSLRRALVAFDLSQIPAGATIDGVSLSMTMSKTNAESPSGSVSLHRVVNVWGEGTSNSAQDPGQGVAPTAGDATWVHTQFDTGSWRTPGGDFRSGASASTNVSQNGVYVWSSSLMLSDVERWIASPEENFGWILVGNESVAKSAKRFGSKENSTEADRPTLTVEFTEAPVTPTLQFAGVSQAEGDAVAGNAGTTTLLLPVSLSNAPFESAQVSYRIVAESASAGSDFATTEGVLTFLPDGPLTQNIEITVVADDVTEVDETFAVQLFDPTGLILETDTVTATIVNDDPEPMITASNVTAREADGVATVTATLNRPSAFPVSIDYLSSAGTAAQILDYEPTSGTLRFAPGETSKTIPVTLISDTDSEPDETFSLVFSNPSGASLANALQELTTTITVVEQAVVQPRSWQNVAFPEDVSGDGIVIARDALFVINAINSMGLGTVLDPPTDESSPPPFLDVNGNGVLDPRDVLIVINYINAQIETNVNNGDGPVVGGIAADEVFASIASTKTLGKRKFL